jgi:hypothetical protein
MESGRYSIEEFTVCDRTGDFALTLQSLPDVLEEETRLKFGGSSSSKLWVSLSASIFSMEPMD